jgi:hypothetical protein
MSAELALRIPAPRVESSSGAKARGLVSACADGRPIARGANLHRTVIAIQRADPKLPVIVDTPAEEGAGTFNSAGEILASPDSSPVCIAPYLYWYIPDQLVAQA